MYWRFMQERCKLNPERRSFLIEDQPAERGLHAGGFDRRAPGHSRKPRASSSIRKSRRTWKPWCTAIAIWPFRCCARPRRWASKPSSRPNATAAWSSTSHPPWWWPKQFARDGSFAGWHGAHAGIGTMPLLLFGTEEQKQKYLPRLSTAEMVARLLPDRAARRLRRAGREDPRRPLARRHATTSSTARRCGSPTEARPTSSPSSRKSAASSSRRSWSSGPSPASPPAMKNRRWASRAAPPRPSSSTTSKVPVENLLGEIGRGHIIAFNILNLGRLKLGPFAVGGARSVLRVSPRNTRKQRKAFGTDDRQLRHDPAQARRDGHPHLRRRVDDVSRGRADRGASRRIFLDQPDASHAS